MCLDTNYRYHPKDHQNCVTSRVAERDILVWKRLNPGGRSPYRNFRYIMGRLYTASMANYVSASWEWVNERRKYFSYAQMGVGLHAMRKPDAEQWRYGNKVYPAIIPKGSRIFIGRDDDIVSNQLVVFQNMKELSKVYGKPQKKGVRILEATSSRERVPLI